MKVVLANGCFDPLHYGHLLHLEAAKKMGDRLVVSVTRDRSVNKGEGRPVFNEFRRARMASALRCVDQVMLVDSALEALKRCKPDIFVKGVEYSSLKRMQTEDIDYCRKNKIRVRFTHTKAWSSTALLHYYAR